MTPPTLAQPHHLETNISLGECVVPFFTFSQIYGVSLQVIIHSLGSPDLVTLHRSHAHYPCQKLLGRGLKWCVLGFVRLHVYIQLPE